ncbi:hypothetical protein K6U56_12480 [Vibrio furnissii]|uniref:hypothetical protein n=1 Tax=Vibrio furnissii TaxID=29494 RepID=UPI001EEA7016|nr:hypothetical protein [Vibrio furnissii]MCG6212775.1 hypothetical protein [Vibrio furnissii]WJG22179.1 hypothetical protein QSU95_03160 [Vibrio furnissii]
MMNPTERRRALNNALERLEREGTNVLACSLCRLPVITIEFPPIWLLTKSFELRERVNGELITVHVARLSGCLVRWTDRDLPQAFQIVTEQLKQRTMNQNLGITQWQN